MEERIYLVGLNKDGDGKDTNFVTTRDQWEKILLIAREGGWNPLGTILDFEFHFQLEASAYGELDKNGHAEIAIKALDRCRNWQGGYRTPEYQVVVDEDTQRMAQALHGADTPPGFLEFLSLGAFRIAG